MQAGRGIPYEKSDFRKRSVRARFGPTPSHLAAFGFKLGHPTEDLCAAVGATNAGIGQAPAGRCFKWERCRGDAYQSSGDAGVRENQSILAATLRVRQRPTILALIPKARRAGGAHAAVNLPTRLGAADGKWHGTTGVDALCAWRLLACQHTCWCSLHLQVWRPSKGIELDDQTVRAAAPPVYEETTSTAAGCPSTAASVDTAGVGGTATVAIAIHERRRRGAARADDNQGAKRDHQCEKDVAK